MDQAHKDILRTHRGSIVEDLEIGHVRESLLGVFSDRMWREIETAGRTREDKASALMAMLPTRGPNAFWPFCEALMTEYKHLWELLIKNAKELPQKVPTRILALYLREKISSTKQEYQTYMRKRVLPVMKALKKVAIVKKSRGKRESEQTVTSLKQIREALKSHKDQKSHQGQKDLLFDESDESALKYILDVVQKLELMRNDLQKDGSVDDHMAKLNSMLNDGVDHSDLYDKTLNKGTDYVKDLLKQGVNDSDIKKFGFVFVLIPYLCDLSERAVDVMRQRSLPTSDLEDFPTCEEESDTDEAERAMSADPEEQDDDTPEDPLSESGYGAGISEQDETQIQTKHDEERLERMERGMEQLLLSNNMMLEKMTSMDQKLGQIAENKAKLSAVSSHLVEIKQALHAMGGQKEMEDKVSKLEDSVQTLLDPEIDRTTLTEGINALENKVAELKEQLPHGDEKIQDSLKEIYDMLVKLDQKQLSEAIDILKTGLPWEHFTEFGSKLGFSENEIIEIRSSAKDLADLIKQRSELLRRWRKQKGDEATVKALVQACRDVGLFQLADKISGKSGATNEARRARPLPPISPQEPQGARPRGVIRPRQTWPIDSKASGAKPKK